ncbi:putative set domain-containing protein [Megavirus courdo11]|uniref:Putative set domain-containing protein n=1 Tax=Megavirus courdo11 TaxID=1128140 RepID=K7YGJ8_9VIRU|nr:putative set domain-containing protein [Megavirus courdo11]
MQTDNEYIQVIYQHPNIEESDINNYKSIIATKNINFGELIILEHAYTASNAHAQIVVSNNETLYDLYHPRVKNFQDSTNDERLESASEKVSHNCFGLNGSKILTYGITKLNHSCNPNCSVYIQEKYNFNNTNIVFMELYAVRNISQGTELTISYGPETAHKRDFECKCGKDLDERKQIFNTISKISCTLSNRHHETIRAKIYEHIESINGKKLLLNHYLSIKGLYLNKNTIVSYTTEGENIVNNVLRKYFGINSKISETDFVSSSGMTSKKTSIFLEILNSNILDHV